MAKTILYKLTAKEARDKIAADEITVQEYAASLLERIRERDGSVEAWAYIDPNLVMASAKALDAIPKQQRGPLHGVALAVKDCILTKDMPTQQNSPIYKDDFPKIDAGPVLTARALGALILGKTVTTEFAAIGVGSKTKNPHDPKRTPGGSSSGSGASVADFQAAVAFGTQTGGSTIRPASFNGIVALKPTHGRVSREGLKLYSAICDTLGIYGRTVEDVQIMAVDCFRFDRLEHLDTSAPFALKDARFAFCKSAPNIWDEATSGTRDAMALAKQLLADAGAIIEDVELPPDFHKIKDWHATILTADGHSSFLGDYHFGGEKLHPKIRGVVENKGRSTTGEFFKDGAKSETGLTTQEIIEAFDGCARLRPIFDHLASQFAAIITPSVPDIAPEGLESTGSPNFNSMWTVLHTPVVGVPGFVGAQGLPVGLSLVGPRWTDLHLLHAAASVETVFAKAGWTLPVH